MPHATLQQLQATCPSIDPGVITDFYHRMDPDYFEQFSIKAIAQHLDMINRLKPETPSSLHIHKKKNRTYDITLAAYDYFSEFSTVCGLLSAFGLDIREASIYTYLGESFATIPRNRNSAVPNRAISWSTKPKPHPTGLFRKKVVDVFQVQVLGAFTFDHQEQERLEVELSNLLRLLDAQKTREVRSRVNRLLIESIGKRAQASSALIHPLEITFNNKKDSQNTIIDIQATDSPAFLYAFSNALTMRGLYISKAKIEVAGSRVQNRFYVRGRQGIKVKGVQEEKELQLAAALIKEFTHYLSWAPDPGKALNHFDLFLDQLLEEQPSKAQISWLGKKENLTILAQLLGASDFLWEDFLRRQHTNIMPILKDFQKDTPQLTRSGLSKKLRSQLTTAKSVEEKKTRLNAFKDKELFRIDMDHLIHKTSLPDFSGALTTLAEVILEQALIEARKAVNHTYKKSENARWQKIPFTICGLGKLGGRELGYASDIEILFIYGNSPKSTKDQQIGISEYFERVAQDLLRWIEAKQEGIFHIDTRLRPHGDKGLLSNSIDEVRHYYSPEGQAAAFERQALIKLRHIAGDATLGKLVETYRNTFVYSREPWPLETALHLRKRQTQELVPSGTIHVKYSPGGLIDVEYTVQYLQLIHGYKHSSLQTTNTIQAICSLQKVGLLSSAESQTLEENYVFLRRLIDALRIVRGNAQDLLLPESGSEGMIFLARRMGLTTDNWQEGATTLEMDVRQRMRRTHKIFVEHFVSSPAKGRISPNTKRLQKGKKSA